MPDPTPLRYVHHRSWEAARAALELAARDVVARRHAAPTPTPELIGVCITLSGWSPAEFADRLGVSVEQVRRWTTSVRGREYEPMPYACWALALLLGGHITPEEMRH